MARITVEDCLKKINNRFILVNMANQRTRQLLKGSKSLVSSPENREVVVALREIAAGKVYLESETIKSLREKKILDAEES
ncbi:MAG: DNA-directed RNA polymerase subunit omega [Pseudomonadota bacterium]